MTSSGSLVRFPLQRGNLTYDGATPWIATMLLGTPPQAMQMMIDTGTLNTWVTGTACTTDACMAHRRFNPDASSSWRASGNPPKVVDFGPWGTMTVVEGNDQARLEATAAGPGLDIHLELATNYQGAQFQQLDCDGGLAVPSVHDEQATALLEALFQQGIISRRIAAFDLDPGFGAGTCLMGGGDPSRYDPATANVMPLAPPVQGLEYLWCVPLEGLVCDQQTLLEGFPFCLDTGSSCFKGSESTIDALRAAITGQGQRPDVLQDAKQLADFPDLFLRLGGQVYKMAPKDYFLQLEPTVWVLGFQTLKGLPDRFLLVGSMFLEQVYSLFDYDRKTVTLAQPWPRPHQPVSLTGRWRNEFGSIMEVGPVAENGSFAGTYSSSTGATGCYPVLGFVDPCPPEAGQTVSFSVSWRSMTGDYDKSWHWVSAFAGILASPNGVDTLRTQYLLQQDPTAAPDYLATAVFPATFHRV